ncbi:glycoside hydrolase family 5 protein [Anaeromicropila herbilytica]|uniref:Endoglucanase n=1 Tax=Anaeromicropila herbilytica TaxID=2785025 RepID=A0A7R7EIN7_9FIRM|nr:cellulase family glycosylhydrolase [Anaeromicropila herbilytica]BCN29487.1 endoglucanase [Anaeromicropila herbilytica]
MKVFTGYQKGINLGGWLSQCNHKKEHYDSFIQEEDIANIAKIGADHVRVPIDYELIQTEEGEFIKEGFTYIDNCLNWCDKYNLNMILDLHKTAGYSFNQPESSKAFFEEEELQERFISLWIELAKRYGHQKDRLAFEILNEIVFYEVVEEWNQIAAKTIQIIRVFAPEIKILIGGVCYNSVFTVNLLADFKDENIVYNFHCYEPFNFTHQAAYWVETMPKDFRMNYPGDIKDYLIHNSNTVKEMLEKNQVKEMNSKFFDLIFKDAIDCAKKRGVALYCGEYGVIDQADLTSTVHWFQDINESFRRNHIGRAMWSYKGVDFGLIDEHYQPIYEELIKYL